MMNRLGMNCTLLRFTRLGVDPLLFGLPVALNSQTAFLSPPVAMAAFYLKGASERAALGIVHF